MCTRRKAHSPQQSAGRAIAAALCLAGAAALAQSGLPEIPPPPNIPVTPDPQFVPPLVPQPLPQPVQTQIPLIPAVGATPVQPSGMSVRDAFAGTLATVVQASSGTLLMGIAQVLTGRLLDWFSQKAAAKPAASAALAPVPAPAPKSTAEAASLAPAALAPSPSPAPEPTIVVGIAFEVHRLGPGGEMTLVDPVTYEFRTGERFVLLYRPSLPGRIDVYNINPLGQQVLIDSLQLAAGQLRRLGPYEFAANTGDEQLRLVMTPCSTPELVLATRDIVRVQADAAPGSGLPLVTCEALTTRSVQPVATRDIRRVAVDGGTNFAIDPLSGTELASGQVTPRELTIRFRHR